MHAGGQRFDPAILHHFGEKVLRGCVRIILYVFLKEGLIKVATLKSKCIIRLQSEIDCKLNARFKCV